MNEFGHFSTTFISEPDEYKYPAFYQLSELMRRSVMKTYQKVFYDMKDSLQNLVEFKWIN